jgi:hypothetical protein
MIQAMSNRVWDLLTLAPLTGPIFDKELRVASRRKRTYLLRLAYLIAMGVLLIPILAQVLESSTWASVRSVRASQEAKEFFRINILLQFYGFQAIALVLMSSSIHEEVLRRTMGTLWSTPIRGFQLVLGKLCGGLFPLLQLALLILPLVVILRAFSSLPWVMIAAGFGLTLTTVLLAGSCTLLISLYIQRPFLVLIASGLTLSGVYGLFPVLVEAVAQFFFRDSYMVHVWMTIVAQRWNPYWVVHNAWVRQFAFYPGDWWKGCLVSTGIAMLLLYRASIVVRRRGLQALEPRLRRPEYRPEAHSPKVRWMYRPLFLHTLVERIFGPGVIWREFVSPLYLGRFRMLKVMVTAVLFTLVLWLLIAVAVLGAAKVLDPEFFTGITQFGFHAGILLTAVAACAVIAREYECQSWPILMTTLLTTREILVGKLFGVLRRSGGLWVAIVLFLGMCVQQGVLGGKPFALTVLLMMTTAWFLTGLGFFLAVWFRRMGVSLAVFVGILATLWYIGPYLLETFLQNGIYAWRYSRDSLVIDSPFDSLIRYGILSNPPSLLDGLLRGYEYGRSSIGNLTGIYVLTLILYGVAGWILFRLAEWRLRKRIFD